MPSLTLFENYCNLYILIQFYQKQSQPQREGYLNNRRFGYIGGQAFIWILKVMALLAIIDRQLSYCLACGQCSILGERRQIKMMSQGWRGLWLSRSRNRTEVDKSGGRVLIVLNNKIKLGCQADKGSKKLQWISKEGLVGCCFCFFGCCCPKINGSAERFIVYENHSALSLTLNHPQRPNNLLGDEENCSDDLMPPIVKNTERSLYTSLPSPPQVLSFYNPKPSTFPCFSMRFPVMIVIIIMGNTSPQNSDLRMHIQTQMQFYNSGSSIQGAVLVETLQNFRFDALYIRIEGQEWCQWFQGSSKNRVKYTGSQHFYTMQYLLDKFQDAHLATGKYIYPFSIELSDNIPGSFQSAKYDAKIEYRLIAYFVHYKRPQLTQTCTIPLIIREPFRQDIVSYHGESCTNPMVCGCVQKGEVKLEASFDRNVCFQGEGIKVKVHVDNTNGSDYIDEVLVKLVQYTFISANNGVSRTYKHTIYSHKIGKRTQKGQENEFVHNMPIPTVSHQTAISTLVANYYRIEVTASVGMFSSDNPSIYSPLFIMKKSFNLKNSKSKINFGRDSSKVKQQTLAIFRAPEYWFKKNQKLSVMNFKAQDMISLFSEVHQ